MAHRAENPWYEVRLFEGRKNQIRMMFKHFGRLVEKLKRVKIGPIDLGPLKPGEFRHLSLAEVGKLQKAVQRRSKETQRKRRSAVLGVSASRQ
jgi:16S rRNA U516 pseudouridylate synthase RsuA-like enzyme